MQTTFFQRTLFFVSLFLLGSLDNACHARDPEASNTLWPTHLQVLKPRPVKSTNHLLVSLETYLGRQTLKNSQSPYLDLISSRAPLVLKDANGLVHKAKKIRIGWRSIPLEDPQLIVRQVLGPFASYESAQKISNLLDEDGIKNVIAYPSAWEVWIASNIELPEGFEATIFRDRISHKVQPFLKSGSVEHLLSGDLSIEAKEGLLWKKGIYSGSFLIKPDAYGTWSFIHKIPVEKYLLGVLPHEIGSSSPANALAAQAVLARTWALANSIRFEVDGYHLCSTTQCQVYKDPRQANESVQHAITQTSGKVLTWKGEPISAVYHATNGGVGASTNEAWSMDALPYLRTFVDGSSRWKTNVLLPLHANSDVKRLLASRDGAFGNSHRLFRWRRILKAEELKRILESEKPNAGLPTNIRVLKRGDSGRVLALAIEDEKSGWNVVLQLDAIRRKLKNLPSTLFYINDLGNGDWEVVGGGFGHGAGLSQAGAIDLALRGWNTQKILKYYYPGTTYESFK